MSNQDSTENKISSENADLTGSAAIAAALEKKQEIKENQNDKISDVNDISEKKIKKDALYKELSDLRAELDRRTKSENESRAKLKEFEGLDAKAAKALATAQKETERLELEKKGDFERLRQMQEDEYKKEMEAVRQAMSDMEEKVKRAEIINNNLTIGAGFDNSAFISKELVLTPSKARLIYGNNFEIEDGVLVAYDKPSGEKERTKLINALGKPMSFDESIKRLVEADPDRDSLIKSKLYEGAKSNSGDGKVNTEKKSNLKGIELIKSALNSNKPFGK